MPIIFTETKNKQQTCSYNNIYLHSSYNPDKEAERFVSTRELSFAPSCIIITEPALSYCAKYLRQRFPDTKLFAIRYCADFSNYDHLWDKVFYLSKIEQNPDLLFNFLGEEGLLKTAFLSWTPGEKPFADEYNRAWTIIKDSVQKAQSVLNTRSYFAKRWLKNSIRLSLFCNQTATLQKGSGNIIVCASGPSLQSSLPMIKENRSSFFLICVSSALSVLIKNNITPDLVISTDGGYWAKLHLSHYISQNKNIPVALSPESACYADIISTHPVVPLFYDDGVSCSFASLFHTTVKAQRNGTVSGTAAQLALELTDGNVYFCGLDLAQSNSFAHTQPNELETKESATDNRLRTKETRITPQTFVTPALEIYKSWFRSNSFGKRLYRLSNNYSYDSSLNEVQDINWDTYIQLNKNAQSDKKSCKLPEVILTNNSNNNSSKGQKIWEIISNNISTDDWIKELFPLENLLYSRSITSEQKEQLHDQIESKIKKLEEDLQIDIQRIYNI